MKRKLLFILLVISTSSSIAQDLEKEIRNMYSQLSVQFQIRSVDGVMQFIMDDFESEQGWNKRVLRYTLSRIFDAYPQFQIHTNIQQIDISTTGHSVEVLWNGKWEGRTEQGDIRTHFPVFGLPFIMRNGKLEQIHEWVKVGNRWKITRVQIARTQVTPLEKKQILDESKSFIEETGEMGLDFGRNILHSIDSNGILLVSGESPLLSVLYLKEVLGERGDITVYDYGIYYGEIPFLIETTTKTGYIPRNVKNQMEFKYLLENKRPVYSMIDFSYLYPLTKSLNREPIAYSIPIGMVYELSTSKEYNPKKQKDVLNQMKNIYIEPTKPSTDKLRELTGNYHFTMGLVSLKMDERKKAYDEFNQAARYGYDVEGLNYNIANIMLNTYQNSTEAIKLLVQGIKYNPWFVPGLSLTGKLYSETEDWKKSILYYENYLLFQPNDVNIHLDLARIYARAENYDFAKSHYLKLQELDPYHRESYLELGKIYEKLKQFELALKNYKTYMEYSERVNETQLEDIREKIKSMELELMKNRN